ncbi:hypothetical protein GCM10009642_62820 [Nocardiopsis metallicus]
MSRIRASFHAPVPVLGYRPEKCRAEFPGRARKTVTPQSPRIGEVSGTNLGAPMETRGRPGREERWTAPFPKSSCARQ